jgi:hypothetical protein
LFVSYYYEVSDDLDQFTQSDQLIVLTLIGFLACFSIFFYIESNTNTDVGRKNLLMLGSLGMTACYIVLVICESTQSVDYAVKYGTICMYLVFFQISIGPI